jgi:hypothetical protein
MYCCMLFGCILLCEFPPFWTDHLCKTDLNVYVFCLVKLRSNKWNVSLSAIPKLFEAGDDCNGLQFDPC